MPIALLLQRFQKTWGVFLLVGMLIGTGGCSTKQASVGDTLAQTEWEAPVYVDTDDGLPLTAVETAAFNSTGELDKNLSLEAMQAVAVQYKYFLHKGRPTMERFSQRAQIYLGYTRELFRSRGLPEELAYLAIIESGYNSRVVSPAGAAGAWQFMPYTGMKYGLNQDWWHDERFDPYKSAEAAAEYLAKLYGDFNDWHLALAAYNAGEGKIGRALAGTGAKDFFSLKANNHMLDDKRQLRLETKQYVPRFLAICKIMRNLEALGFEPINENKKAPVVRVPVQPGTDLKGLAKAAGQDWPEFFENNIAHKQYVSHVARTTYVYVPEHVQDKVASYAAGRHDGEGWKNYTASKHDTWKSISRKSKIPVSVLRDANPGVSLQAGRTLRLPSGPSFVMPTPEVEKRSVYLAQGGTYVVRAGDSLQSIAKRHKTSVAELAKLNGIKKTQHIRVGQRLRVAEQDGAVQAVAESKKVVREDSGRKATESKKSARGTSTPVAQSKKNASTQDAATVAEVKKGKSKDAASADEASKRAKSKNTASAASTPNSAKSKEAASAVAAKLPEKSADRASGKVSAAGRGKSVKNEIYIVKDGDTLWGIARKHNISPSRLKELNDKKANTVRIGERLMVSEQ